jgi:O-antigen/teichoic acid export membrane protein
VTQELPQGVPDLRARVMRGLAWVAASQVVFHITRAIAAILIARLLTPDEYGLAALAIVFASLVMIFSDLALGAALIQRPSLSEHDKNTAFWVTVGSGVAFTALGIGLAGPIAGLYGQPEAEPLLVALSGSFIITALGATQLTLMMREMDFRQTELLALAGSLVGAGCGVALAATGAGSWAIIAQFVAGAIVTTALVWLRSSWYPRFMFSKASLLDLGGFSIYMLGQRILYYLQVNGDRFLIGRFLGTTALGTYAVAYNTMLVPASKIGGPLQRVFSPAFSRIQDEPERIAATWARVGRIIAVVAVPMLGGLVVVAPDFVPVILGKQWTEAVPVIQVLAWVGIIQAIQALNYDVLMARDRTRTMFLFSLVLTACHLVAFSVGLEWGVVGVAVSYAISTTLVEPFQTVLAARCLGVSAMVFFRALAGVFLAGFVMCAIVFAVRVSLVDAGVPQGLRLLICVAVGAIAYAGLCAWRVPEIAGEVRGVLRRRRGGAPAIGAAAAAVER